MASGPKQQCLVAARTSIAGEFSSASRVIDTLLDLRQLAETESETAMLVDSLLESIAGRTVVTNEWWEAALDSLEIATNSDDLRPSTAVDA
ncbi:MAG: hypothetical protein ACR2QO_06585 [Acidimicrobiales bacterium]